MTADEKIKAFRLLNSILENANDIEKHVIDQESSVDEIRECAEQLRKIIHYTHTEEIQPGDEG